MSEVIRIFVEKKDGFNVLAKQTLWDIRHNLGMKSVEDLRYIVRYDLEGLTKEEYEAFGTERLDQLARRFRELECKSDRFLFSDRDEENTTEQNALRTGMKQKEIFYNVHKLLDKAQIPVSYQIESFKRMIDNSKFDMELKIDIMEYRTRVFCYERGTLVFEKYVDDRTLLEYLILNEVVCSYFCVLAGKQHVKTDGYIDMDWERKSEKDAFAAIGDPYKTMYEEGISIFKI